MNTKRAAVLIAIVLCGSFALGQNSSTTGDGDAAQVAANEKAVEVRRLVRQLEDPKREKRDAAEQALSKLGSSVLAMLPEINARTSGELKTRLTRIREQLEKSRVEDAAQATRVTLQGTMNLSDALDKIKEQTGNTIVDYRATFNQDSPDTEVTVDIVDAPFWDALDQLLDEANLDIYTFVGESKQLAVVGTQDGMLPRHERGVYSGLFRIEPTTVTSERNLRNPQGDMLRMNVEMVWEPRVLPILIRLDLEDLEITTDNEESVAVTTTGTIQLPVQPGVASVDIRLPLGLPSREAAKISSLKGKFTALVPGGDVKFEFDDLLAKNVQQKKGGLTVVLDQVRSNGGIQMVYIRMRFNQASESLQSHLDWVENNTIQLIDPEGKPADDPNYEKYLERQSEIGYKYIFPLEVKDLKGWKLTYTTPAGIAEVPVEYELKDIDLP